MSDLFWPGEHRAGDAMSQSAFLTALGAVENAWLTVLVDARIAPESARADLGALLSDGDAAALAERAEQDGNPVTGLVALLRDRSDQETSTWLHRGLTSQDVVDTALILCLRDALDTLDRHLTAQTGTLAALAEQYRDTPALAHTLTQAALPTTAGLRFANWLSGTLDAADQLSALPPLAVQCGGAAGTLAAATELTGSADGALELSTALAVQLRLAPSRPWHTTRGTVTRIGDALVACCDAWGHIAADITTGCRTEIGEYREGTGGASSTMPHKSNPMLSILVRRNAMTAPGLGATLHTASAASVDERADGAWHAEWATLRTLVRNTVVAASQTTELLAGLRFDAGRAAQNLAAADGVLAEQQTMARLTGRQPAADYTGAAGLLVDAAVERARQYTKEQA